MLPGEDSELVTRARQHAADVHGEALAILADAAIAQHRWVSAIEAARTLLAIQPLEEANHRRLLLALDGAGDRAGALQAYETYREVLARELGIDPSADTEKLHLDLVRATPTADEHSDSVPGNRRTSAITAMLAILLVVAVAAAMFEFRERNRARHTARNAQIHSLTVEAGARRASAADLALLLARQANELRDTPETRAALLAVLEEPPGLSHFLRTDAPVTAMAAGPTANTVVTGHANGNIVIWDPERREPLTGNASGDGSAVRAIAVNAETMRVASGTDDGLVQEWDVSTGSPVGAAITYLSPSDGAPVGVASVVYAADGLVVVGRDSTMRRYSATGETVAEEVMQERPNASDDLGLIQAVDRGGSVLVRPGDGGVVLWDLHRPASAGIRGVLRDGARFHGDCTRDRSGRQGRRHERGQCSRPVGHDDGRGPR